MQIREDLHSRSNICYSDTFTRQGGLPLTPLAWSGVWMEARNIDVAVREARGAPHIKCFTHTLNLATRVGRSKPASVVYWDGWDELELCITTVLTSKQKQLELPSHKLIIDITTHHSSGLTWLNDISTRRFEQNKIEQSEALIWWYSLKKTCQFQAAPLLFVFCGFLVRQQPQN